MVISASASAEDEEVIDLRNNPCAGLWRAEVVPNPYYCDRFYVCILTIPNSRQCPKNKVFDSLKKRCVKGNPVTCEIYGNTTVTPETTSTTTSTSTTTTTTTAPPPPNKDDICRGIFFAARPYPNSNLLYVGCIRENGFLLTCDDNEFFNPLINECVDA